MYGFRVAKEDPSETCFGLELSAGEVLESTEGKSDRECLQVAGIWNVTDGNDGGAV